jgi:hypothetical protein
LRFAMLPLLLATGCAGWRLHSSAPYQRAAALARMEQRGRVGSEAALARVVALLDAAEPEQRQGALHVLLRARLPDDRPAVDVVLADPELCTAATVAMTEHWLEHQEVDQLEILGVAARQDCLELDPWLWILLDSPAVDRVHVEAMGAWAAEQVDGHGRQRVWDVVGNVTHPLEKRALLLGLLTEGGLGVTDAPSISVALADPELASFLGISEAERFLTEVHANEDLGAAQALAIVREARGSPPLRLELLRSLLPGGERALDQESWLSLLDGRRAMPPEPALGLLEQSIVIPHVLSKGSSEEVERLCRGLAAEGQLELLQGYSGSVRAWDPYLRERCGLQSTVAQERDPPMPGLSAAIESVASPPQTVEQRLTLAIVLGMEGIPEQLGPERLEEVRAWVLAPDEAATPELLARIAGHEEADPFIRAKAFRNLLPGGGYPADPERRVELLRAALSRPGPAAELAVDYAFSEGEATERELVCDAARKAMNPVMVEAAWRASHRSDMAPDGACAELLEALQASPAVDAAVADAAAPELDQDATLAQLLGTDTPKAPEPHQPAKPPRSRAHKHSRVQSDVSFGLVGAGAPWLLESLGLDLRFHSPRLYQRSRLLFTPWPSGHLLELGDTDGTHRGETWWSGRHAAQVAWVADRNLWLGLDSDLAGPLAADHAELRSTWRLGPWIAVGGSPGSWDLRLVSSWCPAVWASALDGARGGFAPTDLWPGRLRFGAELRFERERWFVELDAGRTKELEPRTRGWLPKGGPIPYETYLFLSVGING